MKLTDPSNTQTRRQNKWTGLMLVLVAAITLEATSLIQFYYSQKGLKEEASRRAEGQLEATEYRILDIVDQAEAAVRNQVWIARWCLDVPDSLHRITERIVGDNPVVVGASMALIPGFFKDTPLVAPYSLRNLETGEISTLSLASEEYYYPTREWFTKPIELGSGYWSEPYIDTGGGEMLMTTFSMPVRDNGDKISAVLTADISLEWLTELVKSGMVYPHAFSLLLSRKGQIMVCPEEALTNNKTYQDVVAELEDATSFSKLGHVMLSGEEGNLSVRFNGDVCQVYFAPVERTGWSMAVIIPEKDIFGGIRRLAGMVTFLQLLGLMMIIFILRSFAQRQRKYQLLDDRRKKMMGELQIASDIQMSMIPKTFPPFPERKDIDMAASIVPAKEVGGDLYDFFIRDEKLYFCIGDVSGKGVPAALVMAVTRSLYRSASAHIGDNPGRIVSSINNYLAETNESNMFVTFFCGILDLQTGHLGYCNAGHNAPLIFTDKIGSLDVLPNLPLGVMSDLEFQDQSCDLFYDDAVFLYTDGLSEAENKDHELFGEERLTDVLHTRRDAASNLKVMQAAVADFVGEAPQSDDLTMLFIHYLNGPRRDVSVHHLTLSNDIRDISRLAGFIDTLAQAKGLDPSLAMSLNLALEEAVTNVILYAYPEGTTGRVDIDAILSSNAITFTLSDSGKPFDPTAAPEADTTLDVEERPIGGLGIYLVRKTMDRVSYKYENGMNILTMKKYT